MTTAKVTLWGTDVAAVTWDEERELAYFEYEKEFIKSPIQLAPFVMPLSEEIFFFPTLNKETFKGLPGLLADSLPDKFGNTLINAWLQKEGKSEKSFNPVDRLCYIGKRGMGALEFSPTKGPRSKKSKALEVDELVQLASDILANRGGLKASFDNKSREEALKSIFQVGTSAGGARAKALIAWNSETNEVHSGQIQAGPGFSYWLLKFDGVKGNKDKELEDPKGFGLIEYAYYKMAIEAGIQMSECRILKENSRNHFMTKRFDRTENGTKLHMQSLCALNHYDFNQAGAYSYEQALQTLRDLKLPMARIEEQFRRMAFNIMGRNQDDHVKNIAFLMTKDGKWDLSPAFDITYSYNPNGPWTNSHQMTLNGKRDNFELNDFKACADTIAINKKRAAEILEQVQHAILRWPEHSQKAGIYDSTAEKIRKTQRVILK